MTQRDLDHLFSAAREVPVQTSVEEVTAWVGAAAATATGVLGVAAKLKLLIAKKSLFMLGSILGAAGITTVGIVLFNSQNTQTESTQPVSFPQEKVQEMTPLIVEGPDEEVLALNTDLPSEAGKARPVAPTAVLAVRAPELIHVMEPAVLSILAPQIRVQATRVPGIAPVHCQGDKDKNIKGSGNVVTRTVEVKPFTVLEIGGIYDVYITQGSTESVKIEADDNLLEFVTVENVKDALVLSSDCKMNIKRPFTMKVHVTVKDLKELNVDGIGDVISEGNIRGSQLKVSNSGVGDVKLALEYNSLNLDYSSVGNIHLSGTVNDAEMMCSGVGNVKAFDLVVQNLELNHNGVGNTEVNASESLDINFSGIGDVVYTGNPEKKVIEKNGIGNVKSR